MLALIIICCILLLIVLFLLIPVGLRADYCADGLVLDARILRFYIRIFPRSKNQKPKRRRRKKSKSKKKSKQEKSKQSKRKAGDLLWLLKLIRPALIALNRLRRKLRMDSLQGEYIIAGCDDPAAAAIRFGVVSAGGGALFPLLLSVFDIRQCDVDLRVDFTAQKTAVALRATAVWRIGSLLRILLALGVSVLSTYLNQHKSSQKRKEENQYGREAGKA